MTKLERNTYCNLNRIEDLEPKGKKRGHGFTKALCKKTRQKRRTK